MSLAPIAEGDSSFSHQSSSLSSVYEADNAIDSLPGQDAVKVDKDEDASFFRLKGLVYGGDGVDGEEFKKIDLLEMREDREPTLLKQSMMHSTE